MMTNSTPDIRAHFGLHTTPFTREMPITSRFKHPEHDAVVNALTQAVGARMSAVLIAPAGTGKSVVIRSMMDELPESRYRLHYIHVADLSKRDFARHLAISIGAKPAGHVGALIRAIQDRTSTLVTQDALRPTIIIDEAHDMRPEVLGLLRLLTNFEVDSKLVISMILVGQPPLKQLLLRDDMSAIRGRLSRIATLRTLTRDESYLYLTHRSEIAGATTSLFDSNALDAMYQIAQGNLRALNKIAFNTLHEAAADGQTVCGTEHVLRARKGAFL